MERADETRLGIRDLVEASGVSRRTVRYYVQMGLLPPPEGAGRGHFYRAGHLERLLRIKELQGRGIGLSEIRQRFEARTEDGEEPPAAPRIGLATRIHLAEGVEMLVSHGAEPPLPSQLRELAEAAARILGKRS